jgi:cbb3-type cytochrome oxidase subunit 3
MDTNDLRILATLFGLCLFIALLIWQWRPARRAEHDAAAQLPFWDMDDMDLPSSRLSKQDGRHE